MNITDSFLDWWKKNKQNYSAALLYIDGTLLIGKKALSGASEFLMLLTEEEFPFALLTNDAIHTTREKQALLKAAGIEVLSDQIISCGDAISYLVESEGLKDQLFLNMGIFGNPNYAETHGLKITRDTKDLSSCKGIIVGELNYDWESFIVSAVNFFIRNPEGLLIVPNPDSFWPTGQNGKIHIGSGGVGRFISTILKEYGIEKNPIYLGKPYELIYKYTLEELKKRNLIEEDVKNYEIFVLGDSLKSDILGAFNMGFSSGLMLTGVTTEETMLAHQIKPDFIFRKM